MFKKNIISYLSLVVGIMFLLGSTAEAQNEECNVTITSPADSSNTGKTVTVKGIASIPIGTHVWSVARRSDFKPLWYPQRQVEINGATNEWETTVNLGEPKDIGKKFHIGIITVNATGHKILMDYWLKAMQTGNWYPIQIPETTSPPKIITVIKTSDP